MKPKLFLDLDGVLADFDALARKELETDNSYKFEYVYGTAEFWKRINKSGNFFLRLDLMPGAKRLFDAVKHLDPIVLTALPKDNMHEVDDHKRRWVATWLGRNVRVITCLTHEKPNYASAGAILVDDRAINRATWEAKGGRFVVYTSADQTLDTLRAMGVI